jgi:hypothetical protein
LDAFERADQRIADRALTPDEWMEGVLPHPCTQLRTTTQHLLSIADELQQTEARIRRLAATLDAALSLLNPHSGQAPPKIVVGMATKITASLNIISKLHISQPCWFDQQVREELLGVIPALAAGPGTTLQFSIQ